MAVKKVCVCVAAAGKINDICLVYLDFAFPGVSVAILRCFDGVCWVTGTATGLQEVLVQRFPRGHCQGHRITWTNSKKLAC